MGSQSIQCVKCLFFSLQGEGGVLFYIHLPMFHSSSRSQTPVPWLISSSEPQVSVVQTQCVCVSYVCVWMDMYFDGQFLAQSHVGTRREALYHLFDRVMDSVGNKVVEAVTGAETTGSDDQGRSNQCH